jgi:UDP-N-acetylmuramate--alanine ligase
LETYKSYYYFIGIGGIGMSALARHFKEIGARIAGYDKTSTDLTQALENEGIHVSYEDEPGSIPRDILNNLDDSLVIYTPAIPPDLKIFEFFKDREIEPVKRAEVLGQLTRNSINISVAGTHGKTTTSCILASIFSCSHLNFSAFLGGISSDLGSNYYSKDGEGNHITITEADEFVRSFLHLQPDFAIITSTDADHLDIYGDAAELLKSFTAFALLVKKPEHMLRAKNKAFLDYGLTYSAQFSDADYSARILERTARGTRIDLLSGDFVLIKDLYINIPGDHNVENALAASIIAIKAGVEEGAIRKALFNFKGIKRRFELIFETKNMVCIDDYAHHPSELEAIIKASKRLYPSKKLMVVFQPHLYSRTQDFAEEFAGILSLVDSLVLLPIYPARELPISGVSSAIILEKVSIEDKRILEKYELMDFLQARKPELLLTLGAGDIDRFPAMIKAAFK